MVNQQKHSYPVRSLHTISKCVPIEYCPPTTAGQWSANGMRIDRAQTQSCRRDTVRATGEESGVGRLVGWVSRDRVCDVELFIGRIVLPYWAVMSNRMSRKAFQPLGISSAELQ